MRTRKKLGGRCPTRIHAPPDRSWLETSAVVVPVEEAPGLFAYTAQIYFDFSGYSDMAIGLGLMMGFQFPINFNRPYAAESITDFWRRWHISLSRWLRDYLTFR